MSSRPRPVALVLVLAAAASLAACASSPAPEPTPAPPPVKEVAPPPAPEPAASASAAAPSEAASAAPPSPAEAQAGAPKGSGRPPVLKMDAEEITDTFGTSAAKLEIGEQEKAVLRIPEDAFTSGVNLTFKLDKKGKSSGPPVGKIYRITPVIPPAATPTKVDTTGPAFELALPAGNKKDANLAIGEIATDDKGKEKIVWTVIAPTKIDDATATAHFELPSLSDAYLHVTSKPVSAPKP